VELLTVIIILGMLIGLVAPSVQSVRRMFLIDQTKGYMHQLTMGVESYRTDIGELPPSDGSFPAPGGKPWPTVSPQKSGAAGLAQCLTGYGDSTKDGLSGPGFRLVRAGSKKYGPYVSQKLPLATKDEKGIDTAPVFQDAFGNTILYYRFDAGSKTYNSNDNNTTAAKGPTIAYFKHWSPGDALHPYDTLHPYYREDYILLSPGPDRVWAPPVTATTTKIDDIANFSFDLKETQP
jgi:type II secretory pathway pseudopilin PulG